MVNSYQGFYQYIMKSWEGMDSNDEFANYLGLFF